MKHIITIISRDSDGNESKVEYRVDDKKMQEINEFFERLANKHQEMKEKVKDSKLIKKLKE